MKGPAKRSVSGDVPWDWFHKWQGTKVRHRGEDGRGLKGHKPARWTGGWLNRWFHNGDRQKYGNVYIYIYGKKYRVGMDNGNRIIGIYGFKWIIVVNSGLSLL